MDSGYKMRINKRFEEVKTQFSSLSQLDERLNNLEKEKERLHNEMNKLDFDLSELTIEMESLYELEAYLSERDKESCGEADGMSDWKTSTIDN